MARVALTIPLASQNVVETYDTDAFERVELDGGDLVVHFKDGRGPASYQIVTGYQVLDEQEVSADA